MVDTRHYILVKTHKMYNAKSEPQCKPKPLVNNNVSILVY